MATTDKIVDAIFKCERAATACQSAAAVTGAAKWTEAANLHIQESNRLQRVLAARLPE